MPFQASTLFFNNALSYLTSKVTRLGVNTSAAITLHATTHWDLRICGSSAAALVGTPGSTTNGWTVKVTSSTAMAVTTTGKAFHVVLYTSAKPIYVTECTTKTIGSGDTVTVPAWNVRISDPSSS